MTHNLRRVCVEEYAYYVNKLSQNVVWKHEYDVKLWRHKQRKPNTSDHRMPLNETPSMKIFCVRHWRHSSPLVCAWHRGYSQSEFRVGGNSVVEPGVKHFFAPTQKRRARDWTSPKYRISNCRIDLTGNQIQPISLSGEYPESLRTFIWERVRPPI